MKQDKLQISVKIQVCEFDESSYPTSLVDSVLSTYQQEMKTLLKYVKPAMIRVWRKEWFIVSDILHILLSILYKNRQEWVSAIWQPQSLRGIFFVQQKLGEISGSLNDLTWLAQVCDPRLGEGRGGGLESGHPVPAVGHQTGHVGHHWQFRQTVSRFWGQESVSTGGNTASICLLVTGLLHSTFSITKWQINLIYSFRSSCHQNYTPVTVLTLGHDNNNDIGVPEFVSVNVPTSCSCFVKDFVFY